MFKYVSYTPFTDAHTTHIFNELNDKCKVNRFDVPYVSVEYTDESDFTELMASQIPEIGATEITSAEFNDLIQHSDQVQRMYNRANEKYFNLMHPVNIKFPAVERETWVTQIEESNEYIANGTEGTMITALAAAAGVSIDVYANAILANKAEYDQFAADGAVDKEAFLTGLKESVGIFREAGAVGSWVTGV